MKVHDVFSFDVQSYSEKKISEKRSPKKSPLRSPLRSIGRVLSLGQILGPNAEQDLSPKYQRINS